MSIFIFEKGNIIITGARNYHHIVDSYNYVNGILLEHTDDIIKKDDVFEGELLLKLYDEIYQENFHKFESLNINI